MTEPELELKVAFYTYPSALFLTLLGTQLIQFFYNRHWPETNPPTEWKEKTENIRRRCRNLLWILQVLFSALILASVILVAREAIFRHRNNSKLTTFPTTAYEVSLFPASCQTLWSITKSNKLSVGVLYWSATLFRRRTSSWSWRSLDPGTRSLLCVAGGCSVRDSHRGSAFTRAKVSSSACGDLGYSERIECGKD